MRMSDNEAGCSDRHDLPLGGIERSKAVGASLWSSNSDFAVNSEIRKNPESLTGHGLQL